jgi:hypothetical protein
LNVILTIITNVTRQDFFHGLVFDKNKPSCVMQHDPIDWELRKSVAQQKCTIFPNAKIGIRAVNRLSGQV